MTFGDLPKVPANIFRVSFAGLKARRENLSGAKKRRLDKDISQYGSLEELKKGCCSSDRSIPQWLNSPRRNAEEAVPGIMKEVYALAEELMNASNEVKEGDPLSPRERILIAIASQVVTCQAGQEGGIHAVYNLSFAQDRKSEIADVQALPISPREGADYNALLELQQEIAPLLQKQRDVIDGMLSFDGSFMKELVPSQSSRKQLVHQELYLKNLLKEDLDLDHIVKMDLHGQCIDKNLRKKSKTEILQVFYRHYVDGLITSVQDEINKTAKASKKGCNMLSSALGTLPEGAMTYDKDTYEITFTRKGAILCLETLGLLEKGSTPPV